MKTLTSIIMKGLAAFVFVALLVVNVHIGSGNSYLGLGDSTIDQAKANCPPDVTICYWYKFPNEPWLPAPGQEIVITPDEA